MAPNTDKNQKNLSVDDHIISIREDVAKLNATTAGIVKSIDEFKSETRTSIEKLSAAVVGKIEKMDDRLRLVEKAVTIVTFIGTVLVLGFEAFAK